MNENKTRIEWIDIAKGIAIILVVLGHSSIPNSISNFIWAFHMPLFFIASGLVTHFPKNTLREFAFHRLRTLMLPFVIYSLIVISLYQFTLSPKSFSEWLQKGWEGYALWFIPVLYISSILTKMVYMIGNKFVRIASVLMIVAIGYVLSIFDVYLPWSLSTVPYACFMIVVGNELKPLIKYMEKKSIVVIIGLFILTALISHFWRLDMCFNLITPIIPLTIGAVAGSVMTFSLSSFISHRTKRISSVLSKIGRETYIVVAFSQIIILIINSHFSMPSAVKYSILIILLIILVCIKNAINKLLGIRIL